MIAELMHSEGSVGTEGCSSWGVGGSAWHKHTRMRYNNLSINNKYNCMQKQSNNGSTNSMQPSSVPSENQLESQSTLVLDCPLHLPESQLDITLNSIVSEVNRSMSKSFQKKNGLSQVDISNISKKMQNSIQSDYSLFDKCEENKQLESKVAELVAIVNGIKQQQAKLRAENEQLKARLSEANLSNLDCISRSDISSLNEPSLLSACIKYKQKYHEYKQKCIQYKGKLEKIRNIK